MSTPNSQSPSFDPAPGFTPVGGAVPPAPAYPEQAPVVGHPAQPTGEVGQYGPGLVGVGLAQDPAAPGLEPAAPALDPAAPGGGASVRGVYVDATGMKKLVPAFAKQMASSYLSIVIVAALLLLANIWIGFFAFMSMSSRYEIREDLTAMALVPVIVTTVVTLILSVAACLLVAIPMRRGLPWSRILGTVIVSLVIMGALAVVIPMVAASGARVGILWIVLLVTSVGWIVNVWSGKVAEPKKRKQRTQKTA